MVRALDPRERAFIAEYLIDGDARRSASAAGYPDPRRGYRLLQLQRVRRVIDEGLVRKRERLAITSERILLELARIAFSNARDYFPPLGQTVDLHRLDTDKTAAVSQFQVDEIEDPVTGAVHRRTKVRLYDKGSALRHLAQIVGLMQNETVMTVEHRLREMTPQQRVDLANELLEKAREYLPAYEAAVARGEIIEHEAGEGERAEVEAKKGTSGG
jgi:phage terminase small subunit